MLAGAIGFPTADMITHVNRLEAEICKLPPVECPIWHFFAEGQYARQIFIPKGVVLTGAVHKTEHLCIISGVIDVTTDEGVERIAHVQKIITSSPGTKRAGYALEDTYWTTVHATHERDLDRLVEELTESTSRELQGGIENKQMLLHRLKG